MNCSVFQWAIDLSLLDLVDHHHLVSESIPSARESPITEGDAGHSESTHNAPDMLDQRQPSPDLSVTPRDGLLAFRGLRDTPAVNQHHDKKSIDRPAMQQICHDLLCSNFMAFRNQSSCQS